MGKGYARILFVFLLCLCVDRLVAQSYNVPASGTDTVSICSSTIYDPGGTDDYSNNCSGVLVVQPVTPDCVMHLQGTYNVESNYDKIFIYDGAGTNGTLLGTYSGQGSLDVVSTTGPLTIQFTSDNSVVRPGFELSVSCLCGCENVSLPRNVALQDTFNGLQVTWCSSPDTSVHSYYLEYGPRNFAPGTGTGVWVTDTSYLIPNIVSGQEYEVHVYSDCGNDGVITNEPYSTALFAYDYNVPSSGMQTISICSGTIYDPGGTDDYSNDCSGVLVVQPVTPDCVMHLQGTYNVESNYDKIFIYDGAGTNGTLLGTYSGQGSLDVVSTTGPLTIQFTSDNSVVRPGFELSVSCLCGCENVSLPRNVSLQNTSDGLQVTWSASPDTSVHSYYLEYGPRNFAPGTGTGVWVTDTSYLIPNIVSGQEYEVHVYSDCGNDGVITNEPYSTALFAYDYNVPSSGMQTISICSGTIYDPDGTDDYSNDCSGVLVVQPVTPDCVMHLQGTYNVESNYDKIFIYDGAGTNGTLLGTYSGQGSLDVVSTTGPLTIQFTSDNSVVRPGFELSVSCLCGCENVSLPRNVSLQNTSDGLQVTWSASPDTSVHSYYLEYGPRNFTPGTGTGVWVTDTSYLIPNLISGQEYEVHVYSDCGNDGVITGERYTSMARFLLDGSYCIDLTDLNSPNVICNYGSFSNPYEYTGIVDDGWQSSDSRHTINIIQATDPRTDNLLNVLPPYEQYSVRLGNWKTGSQAESITYTFHVDTTDAAILLLKYAAVLEDPNHTPDDQPRFKFELLDYSGNLVDSACGSADYIANQSLGWNVASSNVLWKDWTNVGTDLTAYHGQDVRVRLTTYDCDRGAHFGYAYFHLNCQKKNITVETCGEAVENTYSAPAGFSYNWYYQSAPNNIISTAQSVSAPPVNDRLCCKVISLNNPDCYFTLWTSLTSRYPMADFGEARLPCSYQYEFHNHSFVSSEESMAVPTGELCQEATWYFGDGTTSDELEPTHQFPGPGTYPVTLVAMINQGLCADTLTSYLTVPEYDRDTIFVDTTVCESYVWGDSTYTHSGTYTLLPQMDTSCSIVILHLTVVHAPTLNHTPDTVIIPGTSVTLWASGADILYWTDANDDILSSGNSLTVSPATTTAYYLHANNSFDSISCSITDTIHVVVSGYPDNVDSADCTFMPEGTEWGIAQPLISSAGAITVSTPMVGDIDDDGQQEIVIPAGNSSISSTINIFNADATLKSHFNTVGFYIWNSIGLAKVKWQGNEYKNIIVLFGTDKRLHAYDAQGTHLWQSDQPFSSHNGESSLMPAISFADFNHDGWSEVYIGGEVFDAATGVLLCKTNGNKGGANRTWSWSNTPYQTMAADLCGDSKLELAVGNTVYDVDIQSRTDFSTNRMTIARQLPSSVMTMEDNSQIPFADGNTFLADINLDGALDVVVMNVDGNSRVIYLYSWDVETNTIICSKKITNARKYGTPQIGDLDNNGYPEICFITGTYSDHGTGNSDMINALKYNPSNSNGAMDVFWSIPHEDNSGSTGLTMFDFNQDGYVELVYRDCNNLRIINGSLYNHQTGQPIAQPYNLAEISCHSATGVEYPVIADVDLDGEAEIVIAGATVSTDYGHLYVFKSSGVPWAPARKVWNQYMYNVTNVNEDLTVPQYLFNNATVFTDPSGVVRRPFNNFLQQATTIDQYGRPFYAVPDVAVNNANVQTAGDSVTITVSYCNLGDNTLNAPYPVTIFANAYGGDTVCTVTVGENLPVDSCAQGEIRLPISAVCGFANLDSLVIAVNGNSDGIAQNGSLQPECDTTNNMASVAFSLQHDTTRFSMTACDHYLWYSDTLTQSGEYTQVLANAVGCDSVVVMTLQVNPLPIAVITGPAVLCGDSAVTLVADSAFSYLWSTGDTTRSISVTEEGVYALTVANELGCTASDSHQLFFLDNPILSVTVPDMCAGGSYTLSVGYQSDDNINLGQGETTLSMTDTIFLPDGIYCAPFGCSYRSPLTFSAYAPGDTIQSVEDIYYVRLNMEHSYIGDLYINITCPNGQKADLLKYGGSGSSDCSSQIPSSSRGWASGYNMSGGTSFGDANTFSTSSCDASAYGNEPGVGWNYCWSENTTQGYTYAPGTGSLIYRGENVHHGIVDSSNAAAGTHFYHPDDSFSNLIGCPLNGDWYIEVQDGWSVDNGYIFGWELSLSADALPDMEFGFDYSTVDGPWLTTLSDSLFQVTPPVGLEHDTVIAYTFTVYDTTGCAYDTTVYVNVYAIRHTEVDTAVCESFAWNDSVYTVSGQYVQTFTSAVGCDSVVTLHLTINHETNGDTTVVACESFTWHGVTYTTTPAVAPTYTMTGGNHNGCDSVVTLHLTINHETDGDTTVVACESFTWHGVTYTTTPAVAPTYTMTGGNHNGCDSVVTLHLTVNHGTHDVLETDACESYEWHGTTYTTSGTYTYAYTDANGCSSVDTLHLTVHYGTHNVLDTTVCESYEWHGETYTVSDTYIHLYTNANDCPSADTLHLTISSGYEYNFEEVICEGDAYNNHGFVVPSAQTIGVSSMNLTQNLQSQHGCDSILNVSLTIIDTAVQIIPLTEDFCDNMSMELSVVTSMADYVWSTGENSSVITVSAPGLYSVTASEDGCGATAGYAVDECDFMMVLPNAITPSVSDGVNDYFELPEVYQNRMYHFTITIYNRWGGMVFSSHDKSFRWNGEVNGEISTNVLYNYIIQYKDRVGSSFLLKGSLLVL